MWVPTLVKKRSDVKGRQKNSSPVEGARVSRRRRVRGKGKKPEDFRGEGKIEHVQKKK